ncbi:MAG TPA: tetratricopeptide repeat protein [Steroidobacteraceae bacterium]|nr:tetratricopeptide repeat protein [Steroidobacteraceae bacterium]
MSSREIALSRLVWKLPVLLFAAMAASAQSPDNPPGADQKPQVTVTAAHEQPLPDLPPDAFRKCMRMVSPESIDYTQAAMCQEELSRERHVVVEACVNEEGDTAPRRIIQACTEALEQDIFEGNTRFFLFASRAAGYFAAGDRQHAQDDYNEAVRMVPRNAYVRYNRGVFYAAQSDNDAALRDFDAAIGIMPNLVSALRQRAKIYLTQGNFGGALEDYSKAINSQPKSAALWSERGYVSLRQKDYEAAVKDEAEAIRLDPKLARAYFLRAATVIFGRLGESHNAIDDIKTAVDLDASLASYLTINGKTVSLSLPPLQ